MSGLSKVNLVRDNHLNNTNFTRGKDSYYMLQQREVQFQDAALCWKLETIFIE